MNPNVTLALLLTLGRNVTAPSTAQKHIEAAEALLEVPDLPGAVRDRAHSTVEKLTSRWGRKAYEGRAAIAPKPQDPVEMMRAQKDPSPVWEMLVTSAAVLLNGETSLGVVHARALVDLPARFVPPRYDTFRLWLLRTGVARQAGRGDYRPGPNAESVRNTTWRQIRDQLEGDDHE